LVALRSGIRTGGTRENFYSEGISAFPQEDASSSTNEGSSEISRNKAIRINPPSF